MLKTSPAGLVTTFVPATGAPDEGPVTFDIHGNLYVARSDNSILKVTPGGTVTTYVSPAAGLSAITHLAFDNNGNLFVANFGNPGVSAAIVSKVSADGSVTTFVGGTSNLIDGFACDAGGNLYISNSFSSHGIWRAAGIVKVTPAGTVPFCPCFGKSSGRSGDRRAGNLYVAAGDNSVKIVTPTNDRRLHSCFRRSDCSFCVGDRCDGSLYVGDQNDIYKWAPAAGLFTF